MNTPHRHDLQATLDHIIALLERQDLVVGLVHKQHQPRQELVESLVARQQSSELRRAVNQLHPADIAFVLERRDLIINELFELGVVVFERLREIGRAHV